MSTKFHEVKSVFKIVSLCVLAAVLYGIVHDQITARISLEYFTVAHPDIFGTHSPTLLGLIWGIIATWWVGLLLGILLSLAARRGSAPKLSSKQVLPLVRNLMLISGVAAVLSGILFYTLTTNGMLYVPGHFASQVPSHLHARFMAALGAHNASYIVGFVGGIVVAIHVVCRRSREALENSSGQKGAM